MGVSHAVDEISLEVHRAEKAGVSRSRLSVLFVGNTYVDTYNHGKIRELARWCDVEIATCKSDAISHFGLDIEKTQESADYEVYRLPVWGEVGKGTRYAYRGLTKILRNGDYDIIVCESEPWSVLRWQAWLLTRVWCPGASFVEFSWENIGRGGWKGVFLPMIYRLGGMTSDFMVAGSLKAAELCRDYGYRWDGVGTAPQLGVNKDDYQPVSVCQKIALKEERGISPSAFLVGYCGRMVESKGVDDLVRGVGRARDEKIGIELALMGAGDLSEIVGSLSGETWLHSEGPCRHGEVANFLQMLDLFVLPSKTAYVDGEAVWEEQFGHVLIEAMACGIPVIGSDSGAIPEVLGEADVLFAPDDLDGLTSLILMLHRDGKFRSQIIERQHERVNSEFALEPHARKWYEILDKVASR